MNSIRQATLLKIIGLMRKEIDKEMTILEISKKLKIGYRPAYNHINEMERENMIIVKKIGNSRQCLLNIGDAKCRHALEEVDMYQKDALFKDNIKLRIVIESLISKLTDMHISDIHSIILFGSYAKGTSTKNSDIDLLFIVSDMKNKKLRSDIQQESTSYQHSHNIKISPLITDIEQFKKMLKAKDLNVGKEVKEYGISLYGSEMFWRLVV